MPARKISEILGDAPALQELAAVSRRMEQLQRIYLEAVPVDLSESSRVGWTRAGVLSISAANGAVAAKLRQLAPRVLDHLRRRGFEFNSMRIEVQVTCGPSQAPAAASKALTPKALSAIRGVLGATPESPLKDALDRLARRGR